MNKKFIAIGILTILASLPLGANASAYEPMPVNNCPSTKNMKSYDSRSILALKSALECQKEFENELTEYKSAYTGEKSYYPSKKNAPSYKGEKSYYPSKKNTTSYKSEKPYSSSYKGAKTYKSEKSYYAPKSNVTYTKGEKSYKSEKAYSGSEKTDICYKGEKCYGSTKSNITYVPTKQTKQQYSSKSQLMLKTLGL